MRPAFRGSVATEVARNKLHYDKQWSRATSVVEQGAQILVKAGKFTQRMRGRL